MKPRYTATQLVSHYNDWIQRLGNQAHIDADDIWNHTHNSIAESFIYDVDQLRSFIREMSQQQDLDWQGYDHLEESQRLRPDMVRLYSDITDSFAYNRKGKKRRKKMQSDNTADRLWHQWYQHFPHWNTVIDQHRLIKTLTGSIHLIKTVTAQE